jgi:hypothetical protein
MSRSLFVAALLGLFAVPTSAQPPSPVELVRGLRENGQTDLALEYLKELEGVQLGDEDKASLVLERAKCQLEASEDEPDEGTRLGMVAEAKEALNTFLVKYPKHPRAVEALLATAKLTTLDAREQLNRARRMEIPEADAEKDAAQLKQKAEAAKSRPMFLLASKRYAEASKMIREKLDDPAVLPQQKRAIEREAFEAELAAALNTFNTAETYMPASRVTGPERAERNKYLESAKEAFGKLAKGPPTNRTVWVARAWVAEVTYEQDDFGTAANEIGAVLKSPMAEAEDGKRLARFFQLRRNYIAALAERTVVKVQASEQELRRWRAQYDTGRKPTPEHFAVRYYLARVLHMQAESSIGPPPKDGKPVVISATSRKQLEEAEKLYRGLTQTDHDYTARAIRNRIVVVRRLIGEADAPVSSYTTFETAQMASVILMGKITAEEAKSKPDPAKIQAARMATVALLERARELTPTAESATDVIDVQLRLIYYYLMSEQPQQAAVLGEHVAQTIKSTGGKAAYAGLLGMTGYLISAQKVRADADGAAEQRRNDRTRAVELARFLDAKYPNDNSTDDARYRLASVLVEDKRYHEAFEVLTRVRPGYKQIGSARLLEGFVAAQIVNAKPEGGKEPTPEEKKKKADVFKRALADLAKTAKPDPVASEEDVRGYLSARTRIATLLLAQGRADPDAETANPGAAQALNIAAEAMGAVRSFDALVDTKSPDRKLNLDGLEMLLLAQDAHTRALYLRARALTDANKFDEAAAALQPTLDAVQNGGPVLTAEMKGWGAGGGDDPEAVQKLRVSNLAAAVDRTRVDAILAAFRLKVRTGKAAEAGALIDLMAKAGGTIEDNLPMLEPLGREMAAQRLRFLRDGMKKEADEMGAGLSVLLGKLTALPNLSAQTRLFIGQTLQAVGENAKALETLKQISKPEFANWATAKPEEIPAELRGKVQNQTREYAIAQLGIAKALKETKQFPEAEKMLTEIIGTTEKPGWGAGRLYFRKELAAMYEAKGAALAVPKEASAEWGKASKEWATLFRIASARLQAAPKDATPDQLAELRQAFADAFFDTQRVVVVANEQLLKGNPKLQTTYDNVGKKFADIEKQIPAAEWTPEVQHRYAEFLKDHPPLMAVYKAAGGKAFLEKIAVAP